MRIVLFHPDYDCRLWNLTTICLSQYPLGQVDTDARGLALLLQDYRRWGLSPRPENMIIIAGAG